MKNDTLSILLLRPDGALTEYAGDFADVRDAKRTAKGGIPRDISATAGPVKAYVVRVEAEIWFKPVLQAAEWAEEPTVAEPKPPDIETALDAFRESDPAAGWILPKSPVTATAPESE